ncbi:MAG: hypothetical protein GWP10_13235, partial [Nitrospiraceae bacterium]|nr:hypothetical protein [Nitrospiraceae bacterium]
GTVPVIIDKWGRTVIPIRTIVESLGGEVDWDKLTRTITLMFTKRQLPPSPPAYTVYIVLQIGNPQASVNGVKKWIDTPNHAVTPIIINDRTMVPLRFVMENLGCNVEWNPEDRTISIQCEQ